MPKYEDSTMPTKSKVFEYWKERIFNLGFFIDWESRHVGLVASVGTVGMTSQTKKHHTRRFLKFGRKFHFRDAISFLGA
jgi:hypothetical protein